MIFLNKIVATILPLMPQKLIWIFSKRYIAGQSLGAAIKIAKQLNSEGNITTIDLLGEFVSELDQAKKNKDEYIEIIEAVEKSNVVGNYILVLLKPS